MSGIESKEEWIRRFGLQPHHERADGSRIFMGKAMVPNLQDPGCPRKIDDTRYFYRAMSLEEARGWLGCTAAAISRTSGQPWGNNMQYSESYLTEPRHGYEVLLEMDNSEWMKKMKEIGLVAGKAESTATSYFVGLHQNSNSFQMNEAAWKALEREWNDNLELLKAAFGEAEINQFGLKEKTQKKCPYLGALWFGQLANGTPKIVALKV
ncbi:unnamed protein product [Symbiodinium sp. CCMP2592]|nr:unnamed protein product [Symbiodinium sp. CCMP2592]